MYSLLSGLQAAPRQPANHGEREGYCERAFSNGQACRGLKGSPEGKVRWGDTLLLPLYDTSK